MRYKYTDSNNEATELYFDSETNGEYWGVEQDSTMKKVSGDVVKSAVQGLIEDYNYVKQDDIYNGLDSIRTDVPLSANKGRELNESVSTNATNLSAEVLRAKGAETTNATNIASNTTNLSSEVLRAKSAESTNAQAIVAEKERAEGVEDEHNSRLNALEGVIEVDSWKKVQEVVRQGVAQKYFSIGDELVAEYNGVETVFEVLDFDHDIPVDDTFTHSMTIQSKDIMRYGSRIDAPQALYNAEVALPIGTHIFTHQSVQYQFTTTVEIPIGGVIYIATRNDYIPLTLTTYQADRLTEIESGLVCTVTTGTDDLTVVNDYVRCRYSSNRYIDSALRQWMNSSEDNFTWQSKGLYDMPSSYETKGFLKLLDPELVEVLGSVKKQVAKATYDGGGQDLFEDKIFLPSRVELGYGGEGDTTDESVYALYEGATNEDKIKLNGTSPSYWWLRSPYVGNTYSVRRVHPSGELSGSNANGGRGVALACVIV